MEKIIEIKNLKKYMAKDILLLQNFSLDICKGEFVCIFGNSGVGKTALLNLVAGLDQDYDGTISIGGMDRRSLKNENASISYVMKEPVLFENRSVEENLSYVFFKKYNMLSCSQKACIENAMEKFGLVNERKLKVKTLKTWQKKVLNLARAFCKNSKIILIDELFYGVENENFYHVVKALNLLAGDKSKTLICVENVPKTQEFNYSRFVYVNFCKKIEAKSIVQMQQEIDDIFAYFLINFNVEFNEDNLSILPVEVLNVSGLFFKNTKNISFGSDSVLVSNCDLLDVYSVDREVKAYLVDGVYFDKETGLRINKNNKSV